MKETDLFPKARIVPFSSFNNRYAGRSCTVVGRGPTDFDYAQLAAIAEPVFFVNDAVCLEKHTQAESFFFAHDPHMRVWLDGSIRSTAVLPIDGKLFTDAPDLVLNHTGAVVFYHWLEKRDDTVLRMSRDELAVVTQLFTHTATIHSLLHFVWFCGFRKVTSIGCDGSQGHDSRLENRSGVAEPDWHYADIRRVQDLLARLLSLELIYRGSPSAREEPRAGLNGLSRLPG